MKIYYVCYKMYSSDEVHGVDVKADNKGDAYDKAVYETIPDKTGSTPYSAWVAQVQYSNGSFRVFNAFEGKPF